ncbi:MAG: nicotinate-nucleotide adenylyltransferase [Candidatus Fimadaptatus sp.]
MAKRLGIMGGTFNPVHCGHICIAGIARRELELDEVRFMPSGDPPHKRVGVSGAQRLEMVRMAVRGYSGFTISDMEIRRRGRSYTCDTLREISEREPDADIYFILGDDMFMNIDTWRHPEEIMRRAALAVAPRPGEDGARVMHMRDRLRAKYGARVCVLSGSGPDISSTEVRRRVMQGGDISRLVPGEVAMYIAQNGLYLSRETCNDT